MCALKNCCCLNVINHSRQHVFQTIVIIISLSHLTNVEVAIALISSLSQGSVALLH